MLSTRDEIPHAIAVDVDEMKTRDDGTTYIRATIYCDEILKRVSSLEIRVRYYARLRRSTHGYSKLLATKVYLDLWVKVKKDWRNKSGMLSEFGI